MPLYNLKVLICYTGKSSRGLSTGGYQQAPLEMSPVDPCGGGSGTFIPTCVNNYSLELWSGFETQMSFRTHKKNHVDIKYEFVFCFSRILLHHICFGGGVVECTVDGQKGPGDPPCRLAWAADSCKHAGPQTSRNSKYYSKYQISIWGFPTIGVPLNHPCYTMGFPLINFAFGGTPMYGNHHM